MRRRRGDRQSDGPCLGCPASSGGSVPELSVLTLGEIRRGIELHRLQNPTGAGNFERWLIGIETHYADRLLPITAAIADRWGRLCLQQRLPVTDSLLAATGLEHKLTLVTRNVGDFQRSGVNVLNPFS